MTEKVVIIGGGPAGLAAAIYASRAGLNPLVFAGFPPGGQLSLTEEVENYPGYETILGPQLIEKMRNQAKRLGARIVDENVIKVNFTKKPFEVYLSKRLKSMSFTAVGSSSQSQVVQDGYSCLLSRSVIIATGTKALWLNLPSEQRLRSKGVSACATCDGFFFKNKVVAVVGGGDTALVEALILIKFVKKLYLIHRRHQFRACKLLQQRIFANKKIEIIWNAQVEEVLGQNKVEGVRIRIGDPRALILDKKETVENQRSKVKDLKLDGIFIAIGHKPNTELFKGQIEIDGNGYIYTSRRIALEKLRLSDPNFQLNSSDPSLKNLKLIIPKFDYQYHHQTSVSGVFAAGDCVDQQYQQAVIAAGSGAMAALDAEKYLINN